MKKYIILHHTADPGSRNQFSKIQRYHDSGAGGKWPKGRGIQYHWFIEKDGKIICAREETAHLWNAGSWFYNHYSIAICLAGHFLVQNPSQAQLKSLEALLSDIQKRLGISDRRVLLHWEVRKTACPGQDIRKLLPTNKTLKEKVRQAKKPSPKADSMAKRVYNRLLKRLLIRSSNE